MIDSTAINIIKPTSAKEAAIFSDPKLSYKKNIADGKGMFEKFLEWLAEKLFGKPTYDNISSARELVIWTIVIVSILIIIWLLSKSELIGLVKPKAKATSFNFSDITEDLDAINFNEKINDAEKAGDLRLAIRWHYLKLLYLLDKKNLIAFAPFKTNIDYNYELKGKTIHDEFVKLSRTYDYVWYGQFTLTHQNYEARAAEFDAAERKINV